MLSDEIEKNNLVHLRSKSTKNTNDNDNDDDNDQEEAALSSDLIFIFGLIWLILILSWLSWSIPWPGSLT